MIEVWKDVEGYDDKYQVSNLGNVRNKQSNKLCKISKDRLTGYSKVGLWINGKTQTKLIHRLVAEAFIDNSEGKEQVHHIDGNKQNNTVDNLEWVTPKEHGIKMLNNQKRMKKC